MNRDNLIKVRNWLVAGAPTATFDMNEGVIYGNEHGIGACGTTCCIAGAAFQFAAAEAANLDGFSADATALYAEQIAEANRDNRSVRRVIKFDVISDDKGVNWVVLKLGALEWLGLANSAIISPYNGFGHDLFNPELAPENCTPAEAAQAVQNVLDHGEPRWDDIREARGEIVERPEEAEDDYPYEVVW